MADSFTDKVPVNAFPLVYLCPQRIQAGQLNVLPVSLLGSKRLIEVSLGFITSHFVH